MITRPFAGIALPFLFGLFLTGCQFQATPMDIRSLQERTTPRDSLACPPGMCRVVADFDAPRFTLSAEELIERVEKIISRQPRTRLQGAKDALKQRIFVQRTRIFRFPDTVWIQAVADGTQSALIVYSRSNIGYWDMGTNKRRVRRFIRAIEKDLNAGGHTTPASSA